MTLSDTQDSFRENNSGFDELHVPDFKSSGIEMSNDFGLSDGFGLSDDFGFDYSFDTGEVTGYCIVP